MLQQQHRLPFNHPSIEQNTTLIYQKFKNYQTYACRFDKNSAVSGKNCTKTQFVKMLINLCSAINSPFPKTTGRNEFVNYPLLKIVLPLPDKDNTFYLHHHLRRHHIQVSQLFHLLLGPNKMETRESFIKNYMQNIHFPYFSVPFQHLFL